MTIQQIVRDLLERAIEDGLVASASPELRFGAEAQLDAEEEFFAGDPQRFTAEDLAGCTALLADYIRRKVGGKAPEETENLAADSGRRP